MVFFCILIYCFDNVDEFLFVFQYLFDFVVVIGVQIDYYVFVVEEEYEGVFVVEFVYCVEVGDFFDVVNVQSRKLWLVFVLC